MLRSIPLGDGIRGRSVELRDRSLSVRSLLIIVGGLSPVPTRSSLSPDVVDTRRPIRAYPSAPSAARTTSA